MSILYVYLGQKGGGQEFNRIMQDFYSRNLSEKIKFLITNKVVNAQSNAISKNNFLKIHRPNNILNLIRYLRDISKFYSSLNSGQLCIDKVVILMMSPWDYPFMKICRMFGKEIILIVHDVYPHPGEFWPFKRSILKRINMCTRLVFLSESVLSKYHENFPNKESKSSLVIPHPIFEIDKKIIDKNWVSNEKDYILFIGRISKYKGIDILIDAVKSSTKDLNLVIAGSGKINKEESNYITYINKWLSNEEILRLISEAKVIVFPYIEASQSGLLPIAMSLKKTIVVSDQPGLIEQSANYVPLKVFRSGNSAELRTILEMLFSSESARTQVGTRDIKSGLTERDFASKLHHFAVN